MTRLLPIPGLLLGALLGLPRPLPAGDWSVEADGSGDAPTIQAGLDAAADGDTVTLGPGLYAETLLLVDKSVTLRSRNRDDPATLHPASQGQRILTAIRSGGPVVLQDLVLERGFAGGAQFPGNIGGAVAALVSPLFVEGCVFRGNISGGLGGAIYCTVAFLPGVGGPRLPPPDPGLRVVNSRFGGGRAGDEGGAVYACDVNLRIEGSVFEDLRAVLGGAVGVLGGRTEIVDSEFLRNTGREFGGGVYVAGAPGVRVERTRFEDNDGTWHGGGLEVRGAGGVLLRDCAFLGNRAVEGAGVLVFNSSLTAEGVLWGRNVAELPPATSGFPRGGGILVENTTSASFVRCTWIDNSAPRGASLRMTAGPLRVTSCYLGDDDALASDCRGATIEADCNIGSPGAGGCIPFVDLQAHAGCSSDWRSLCSLPAADGCGVAGHATTPCLPGDCEPASVRITSWGALKARYGTGSGAAAPRPGPPKP